MRLALVLIYAIAATRGASAPIAHYGQPCRGNDDCTLYGERWR